MIGRLGLIMLIVADLERSLRFYSEELGLPVKHRTDQWVELDAGTISVGLHLADDRMSVNSATSCSFAFYVDDAERATLKAIRGGGQVVHATHEESFGSLAVISDPDGYRIQLIELLAD